MGHGVSVLLTLKETIKEFFKVGSPVGILIFTNIAKYVLLGFFFLKILFIYFLESGEGKRKRRRETPMCGCVVHTHSWHLAHNPGMCPNWESNQQTFGSQAVA